MMKRRTSLLALVPVLALASGVGMAAPEPKRDIAVVQGYIRKCAGEAVLGMIKKREGGAAFLKRFFSDRAWMEQFAGSGSFGVGPLAKEQDPEAAAKALSALDLLVWNDKDDFIGTPLGRNIATALALNHGADWDDEKLVQVMECYREWAADGTLNDSAQKMDTRQWREVVTFGQNAELPVECLRWIHDFANVPADRYGGVCWECHYRLENCFGDSVHGPMYYKPWEHRWNTEELRYRVGGVCGGLSKFGSHCAEAHGVRSYTAGQPGHCAYMLWDAKEGRWGLAYSVTSHTNPHFNLCGGEWLGFAAVEEQDRYYSDPKRMGAEYLRWAGQHEAAMRYLPGNWQAAKEWQNQLRAKNAPKAEWDKYAAAVRETFREAPCLGWSLYFPYLDELKGKAEKLEAARQGCLAFRENPAKSVEPLYLDERVLDPLMKKFGDDKAVAWELLPALLDGQARTQTFFRQAINWAAGRLMGTPADAKRFLDVVGKAAAKTKTELDFNGMVLKASQNADLDMWRQVYSLMDKMAPQKRGKLNGKKWPATDYGAPLLSADGLLQTSTTSGYEEPMNYRDALDAEGRTHVKGGAPFHTEKEVSPWAMVVLPGASEVTGVTVVNAGSSGYNAGRQVPLKIWLSEDGKNFTEAGTFSNAQDEWRLPLNSPRKAKYIKVGRTPEERNEVFHLGKILVYGKKLY